MRIQRSIYFYENISKRELDILIDEILKILDKKRDDFRIYTIKDRGLNFGNAIDLDNSLIII